MRYFLLPIIFLFFVNADTNNIDTSSFDYGKIMPIEFSYINTKDDGALYHMGIGIGGFLEYDLFELQLSFNFIRFRSSDTLFYWNDKMPQFGDTFKWGGTIFYKLSSHWQIGVDYSKYIFGTNEGKLEGGTTYGYMSSYGLKFLYDPLADIMEQDEPLLMVFLLGYINAPNITYKEEIRETYNYSYIVEKRYDLSGPIVTFGLMKKF